MAGDKRKKGNVITVHFVLQQQAENFYNVMAL